MLGRQGSDRKEESEQFKGAREIVPSTNMRTTCKNSMGILAYMAGKNSIKFHKRYEWSEHESQGGLLES